MRNSSTPLTDPEGDAAETLPVNLRRLRREAKLTLDRLAELSGVSRAMISKIERGTSVPTATVLGKLAAALQISLSQLLGEFHARQPRLHRKEKQTVYHDPTSGFERRSLSPVFEDGAVDLALNLLPPGESVEFPPHHAGVEEFLVVHEGALTVLLDGARFDVKSGDTLFYPSDCVHEFRNEGERSAVFYIVINDRTRR
ncbi:cupin domain-containing protein [Aromatoleum aromaticum]|nr:XRE family transcriptional regulator [Aromatoleum aromaticum]NMG56019.1 cupin domain-containing protein [Aromatoleum aromaticum]